MYCGGGHSGCGRNHKGTLASSRPAVVNRVVGNLVVEADPVFGGGELSVEGSSNARDVEFLVYLPLILLFMTNVPCLVQETRPTGRNLGWH